MYNSVWANIDSSGCFLTLPVPFYEAKSAEPWHLIGEQNSTSWHSGTIFVVTEFRVRNRYWVWYHSVQVQYLVHSTGYFAEVPMTLHGWGDVLMSFRGKGLPPPLCFQNSSKMVVNYLAFLLFLLLFWAGIFLATKVSTRFAIIYEIKSVCYSRVAKTARQYCNEQHLFRQAAWYLFAWADLNSCQAFLEIKQAATHCHGDFHHANIVIIFSKGFTFHSLQSKQRRTHWHCSLPISVVVPPA